MTKAIFFDADGTLIDPNTGRIAASSLEALNRARAAGILLALASGRHTTELENLSDFHFDAYATSNGQYCFDDDGAYRVQDIDKADIAAMLRLMDDWGFACAFVEGDCMYVNKVDERVVAVTREIHLPMPRVDTTDRLLLPETPVLQMNPYIDADRDVELMRHLPHCQSHRWHRLYTDVMPAQGGKGAAVAATLDRWKVDPQNAFAFGDGANDIAMLKAVGTGVAMGNAQPVVKQAAAMVTAACDDAGILKALVELGLI